MAAVDSRYVVPPKGFSVQPGPACSRAQAATCKEASADAVLTAINNLKLEASPPPSPPLAGRSIREVSESDLEEKKGLCELLKRVRQDRFDPVPTNVRRLAEEWEARNFQDLGNLQQLKSLHLACQNLTELPRGIRLLKGLVELNLNGNQLKTLPLELEELPHLRILHLAQNCFESIPPVILKMAKANRLHTLSLNQNVALRQVEACLANIEVFELPNFYSTFKDD